MFGIHIQVIKGLLIHPGETFTLLKQSSLTRAYRHYVVLLIFYTVLAGMVSVFSASMSYHDLLTQSASIPVIGSLLSVKISLLKPLFINWAVFITYITFLLLLLAVFFKGLFLHAFVILVGGEQGAVRTIQAVMYAATPFFLFGWIPYTAIPGAIWSLLLCIIGLMILQDLPGWKACAVIFIPLILGATGGIAVIVLLIVLKISLLGLF
jgi:hypothetical protein